MLEWDLGAGNGTRRDRIGRRRLLWTSTSRRLWACLREYKGGLGAIGRVVVLTWKRRKARGSSDERVGRRSGNGWESGCGQWI